jgi:hypothetical protein
MELSQSLMHNKWYSKGFLRRLANYVIPDTEKMITDLHHRVHKSKWRIKVYPLFIDSLLNLVGMNNSNHINNNSRFKITDLKAEKYQRFLENHPKIAKFVNGEL